MALEDEHQLASSSSSSSHIMVSPSTTNTSHLANIAIQVSSRRNISNLSVTEFPSVTHFRRQGITHALFSLASAAEPEMR
ncbi:hypothetical protein CTA1_9383 [Colletotrichum tanaceti]|uniref:Uncharacterized protein n=1 Tax=Colletotrichum tanaceti TaxID=1306861 RepID=A0A4U6X618_9PEZI|nr:hypothetical protein CTA1_9383 [Colletotrichum tanaceti]